MSYNFQAGQYERPFAPKSLRNWEVPRWFPARPRSPRSKPATRFLADDRGHLLPKARKGAPAWGNFPNSWDYPHKISREQANELNKEPPQGRYLEWLPKSPKNSKPEDNTARSKLEYEPGCLTDPKQKIEIPPLCKQEKTLEELCGSKEVEEIQIKDSTDSEINSRVMHDKQINTIRDQKNSITRRSLPAVNLFPGFQYARKMHMDNLLHQPLPDAIAAKTINRRHKEPGYDLDIKPYSMMCKGSFPDSKRPFTSGGKQFSNNIIENIPSQRPATTGNEKNSMKNVTAMDLAIRWDYKTKHPRDEPRRPKHIDGSNGSLAPAVFSMVHSPKQDIDTFPNTGRSNAIFSQNIPTEVSNLDKLVPKFEKDMSKNRRLEACDVPKCDQHSCYERQRSPSVDCNSNSNGSKSQSKNKHRNSAQKPRSGSCDGIHGCGTISISSGGTGRRGSFGVQKPIKNGWIEPSNKNIKDIISDSTKSKKHNEHNMYRDQKTLDKLNNNGSSIESFHKEKLHQSSPNISKNGSGSKTDSSIHSSQETTKSTLKTSINSRACMACDDKSTKNENHNPMKVEYKMAFKAGKPNSSSSSDKNGEGSNSTKNSYKVPKMRDPYSKKSYAIPTLAPPFSRWKDSTGYPEHWRLASVYQHAYKHPENRRHPLLPAVYR